MVSLLEYREAEFEQVTVMAPYAANNQAAKNGSCHTFSCKWLRLILSGQGSAAAKRIESMKENVREVTMLQTSFASGWKYSDYQKADELVAHTYGLKIRDAIAYGPYNKQQLINTVTNCAEQDRGFVYSFWFPGTTVGAGGAHSIAFCRHHTQKTVYVFEPNFGELILPAASFHGWMDELVTRYNGRFDNHWLRYVSLS